MLGVNKDQGEVLWQGEARTQKTWCCRRFFPPVDSEAMRLKFAGLPMSLEAALQLTLLLVRFLLFVAQPFATFPLRWCPVRLFPAASRCP